VEPMPTLAAPHIPAADEVCSSRILLESPKRRGGQSNAVVVTAPSRSPSCLRSTSVLVGVVGPSSSSCPQRQATGHGEPAHGSVSI
jgi:hypothetical protein